MYSAYDPNLDRYFHSASNCETREECLKNLKEFVTNKMGVFPDSKDEMENTSPQEFVESMNVEIREHDEELGEEDFSLDMDVLDDLESFLN